MSGQANLLTHTASVPVAPKPQSAPATTPNRLGGTPLHRPPTQPVAAQPRNRVQEAIYNQVRVTRNEPPAENLPRGASMRPAENPV